MPAHIAILVGDVVVALLLGALSSLAYGLPSQQLPMTFGYAAVLLAAAIFGRRCGFLTIAAIIGAVVVRGQAGAGPIDFAAFAAIAGILAWLAAEVRSSRRPGDVLKRFQADREQRALLDHLPKMVWIAEPDGTMRYHNRYWYEYTGLSGDEGWQAIVHPEDMDAGTDAWRNSMATAQPLNLEMRFRRADGSYRWHLVKGVPIIGADGKVHCWYGASTDIEDQKRAMETLALANQRISRFLAVLSHELRNPLAGVTTASDLLHHQGTGPEQRKQALATLHRQSQHLRRMVDDLLDISRVTQGKVELRRSLVEIGELLDEVHRDNLPVAQQYGVVLVPPDREGKCHVRGDHARLRQVLDNLVSNAIKACEPGQRVFMSVVESDGESTITVSDEGQGLDQDFVARMFDPFVQSPAWQSRGLGLGLSIVKHITELHGGQVSVHSDGPARGASFTLKLPCESVTDGCECDEGPVRIAPAIRAHVLIVEDELENAEALQTLLELEGHRASIATDAESALRLSREDPVDIVMCDLELKDGMSGYDVARMLQSYGEAPYLIAYSGYGQQSDRDRTRLAGFQQHLVKPATLTEILGAIDEGLRQGPGAMASGRRLVS
ncbi:ATP-binding protein [Lysobacter sp. S4-A87]|uniref:hybrid sensor histidine kinase/response regulator n=1 Tax=Lysobacter sp. S4-A87 TaxID=2925843 RepID=UPI001F52E56B|nr:ATP-binding protein [Lysobacter sp. S4-A87]UNK49782.1 ATP-binding protein [Lysobacter sp. S4-A87]